MAQSAPRDTVINLRAPSERKALIDKAASAVGKKRSDFMLDAAYQAAENVLLDQRLFRLDAKAFAAFNAMLDAPVEDNPALREMLAAKAPWEK